MSQNSPFGTPLEPGPAELPAGPPEPATGSGNRRTLLIAGASAAVLAVAGVAAFVLTGSSDEDPPPFSLPTRRPSVGGTATPTGSPTVSVLPTDAAVNARNPFLRPPSASPSGSGSAATGGGGGQVASTRTVTAVRTVVNGNSTVRSTETVKSTATVRSTATATPTAVYLALFDIEPDGKDASFRVNSVSTTQAPYVVDPGQRFGPSSAFLYQSTYTDGAKVCAVVTYVEESFSLCPGAMVKVH